MKYKGGFVFIGFINIYPQATTACFNRNDNYGNFERADGFVLVRYTGRVLFGKFRFNFNIHGRSKVS